MIRKIILLCLPFFFVRHLCAQSPADTLNFVVAPGYSAKPVVPVVDGLKDPFVLLAPDHNYYLTGTKTGGKNSIANEIALYVSADLKSWRSLGAVYKIQGRPGKYHTAAELHYINQNYYLIYTKSAGGAVILKSTTSSTSGPYTFHASFNAITYDASLFADDGKVYLVYAGGMVATLSNDLKQIITPPVPIVPSVIPPKGWGVEPVTDHVGTKGAQLLKINGRYCLMASDGQNRLNTLTDDVFISVSSGGIFGPYERRYMAVPNASHSCIFQDKTGKYWSTYSGSSDDPFTLFSNKTGFVPLKINALNRLMVDSSAIVEAGPMAKLHPVFELRNEAFRDPSICKGADGFFYLVGTHGWGWQYPQGGIELWKSADLKHWAKVGLVWSFAKDADWQKPRITDRGERKSLWAPEINYFKGTYWMVMSMNYMVSGILKSTTGKPEGPYINPAKTELMNGIDGFFFPDTDGSVYLIWKRGLIARMKDDMSGFAEEPKQIWVNDLSEVKEATLAGKNIHMMGYEGCSVIKYKNKYVLFSTDWFGDHNGTYDLMYGISDNIYGPYDKKRYGIPHAGHATVFKSGEKIYTTIFGGDATAPFQMRLGITEITFDDDWNLKIVENGIPKSINNR